MTRPAFLSSLSRPDPNSAIPLIDLSPLFQEMTMPPTPLTAIAQTPRKELESKFTFNPVMAKVRIYAYIYICIFVPIYRLVKRAYTGFFYSWIIMVGSTSFIRTQRVVSMLEGGRGGVSIVETFRIVSSGRREKCFVPLGTVSRSSPRDVTRRDAPYAFRCG